MRRLATAVLLTLGTTSAEAATVTYWSLFNIEGESAVDATYGSLPDMLNDENRTGQFAPDGNGAPANVVGSGATIGPDAPSPVPLPASWLLLIGATGALAVGRRLALRMV